MTELAYAGQSGLEPGTPMSAHVNLPRSSAMTCTLSVGTPCLLTYLTRFGSLLLGGCLILTCDPREARVGRGMASGACGAGYLDAVQRPDALVDAALRARAKASGNLIEARRVAGAEQGIHVVQERESKVPIDRSDHVPVVNVHRRR